VTIFCNDYELTFESLTIIPEVKLMANWPRGGGGGADGGRRGTAGRRGRGQGRRGRGHTRPEGGGGGADRVLSP
jgi:hypothetical protein